MKPSLLLITGLAALLSAGCSKSEPPSTGGSKPRIALVMKSLANEFFGTMAEGARKHAGALRRLAMLFAFFAPAGLAFIALFVGGGAATACAVLSAPVCLAGVAIERWLFFAEARHVVTLYYGRSLAAC